MCIINYLDTISIDRLRRAMTFKMDQKNFNNNHLLNYMVKRIKKLHNQMEIIDIFSDDEL